MSKHSNDRTNLCAFTFADGRRCRMPCCEHHLYLCTLHARKEAQAVAGQKAANDISYHLSGAFLSACDLSLALGRLFTATAQGQMKPKTAPPSPTSPTPSCKHFVSLNTNTSIPSALTHGAKPSVKRTTNPSTTFIRQPSRPKRPKRLRQLTRPSPLRPHRTQQLRHPLLPPRTPTSRPSHQHQS